MIRLPECMPGEAAHFQRIPMTQSRTHVKDVLKLTPEEAESLGVEFPGEPGMLPEDLREHPLHEQVAGALTEGDVVEALAGEVTPAPS